MGMVKKTRLYFTAEYFNEIPTYTLIDGKEVIKSEEENYDTGTDFTSYKFGNKSIINYAIGFKQELNVNFDFIFGFRTDFNSYKVSNNDEFLFENEVQKVHSNLYHITIGSNFNYKRSQFIVGFQYSYGKVDNSKNDNTSQHSYKSILSGNNLIYTTNSLGLFIGYSIKF